MKRFLVVVAAMFTVLFFTNPGDERHRLTVGSIQRFAVSPEARQKLIAQGVDPAVVGTKQTELRYHNYILFSTETDKDGGLISIGLLRMVFDLRTGTH